MCVCVQGGVVWFGRERSDQFSVTKLSLCLSRAVSTETHKLRLWSCKLCMMCVGSDAMLNDKYKHMSY